MSRDVQNEFHPGEKPVFHSLLRALHCNILFCPNSLVNSSFSPHNLKQNVQELGEFFPKTEGNVLTQL